MRKERERERERESGERGERERKERRERERREGSKWFILMCRKWLSRGGSEKKGAHGNKSTHLRTKPRMISVLLYVFNNRGPSLLSIPVPTTAGKSDCETHGGTTYTTQPPTVACRNGSSVGILYTLHTRLCTFGADLYAQSVLTNKNSASELSRKFIKSALLVG